MQESLSVLSQKKILVCSKRHLILNKNNFSETLKKKSNYSDMIMLKECCMKYYQKLHFILKQIEKGNGDDNEKSRCVRLK